MCQCETNHSTEVQQSPQARVSHNWKNRQDPLMFPHQVELWLWYHMSVNPESIRCNNRLMTKTIKTPKHLISTQNLEALNIWITSPIYRSFNPILVNARLTYHLNSNNYISFLVIQPNSLHVSTPNINAMKISNDTQGRTLTIPSKTTRSASLAR